MSAINMRLLNAVVSDGDGATNYLRDPGKSSIPYSLTVASGTPSVTIQGRVSDEDAWVVLVTAAATEAGTVAWFPQMRASATTVTGAVTVSVHS